MVMTPEETQLHKQDLHQLQENKVFKEMLIQLQTRLTNRHRAQRLELQQCNKDKGLLLEGVIVGLEEALNIYNAQIADKPQSPTIKY